MEVLKGLAPENVFRYFEQLCSVPHGSGNNRQISDLCVSFAKEHHLRCRQDEAGNVIIWKDASPGMKHENTIILQGHLDMVCAKTADCTKDMAVEGLDLVTDGEWVWADKTSLGGDNCIAVAMIMAILADDSLVHPPLEAVFTVDEEVGMDGAFALDCSDLQGREMVNIDSEDEGVFTVSCAGGVRCDCFIPAPKVRIPEEPGIKGYHLTISGLQSGHSGADIHTGRASAIQLMARLLYTVSDELPFYLADLRGGEFDNVICPQCEADVAVLPKDIENFERILRTFEAALQNEYAACGEKVRIDAEEVPLKQAAEGGPLKKLLGFLTLLPQGVQAMSADFPGLVQTSANQGMIRMDGDGLHMTLSIRSSIASQKEMILQRVRSAAELAGGTVQTRSNYPGWQYARESRLRDRMLAAYKRLSGRDGVVEAIHAGLECGLFVEKIPGLDAISIGPDINDVHSANERLSVGSTARVYQLVCEFLKDSAQPF